MEEVKAISQNVMHANTIITDQVYSGLTTDQVRSVITNLGNPRTEENALSQKIEELLVLLKQKDPPA